MIVNFVKMHGLGNDFVVIDLLTQNVRLQTSHLKRIADRHLGIGCDQIILIDPPIRSNADFYYRIFNADGVEVEQCGNGARCAAQFFYSLGFASSPVLHADCLGGPIELEIKDNGQVTVNMGIPKFKPHHIPMELETEALNYPITLENETHLINAVSIGNPHIVLQVPDIESAPVKKLGALLTKHALFPNGTNVGFMEILDQNTLRLRVYERGVGETLSCGSGACAAAVIGQALNLLDKNVTVIFSTGKLQITWEGRNKPIYMTGPTTQVFTGRFCL